MKHTFIFATNNAHKLEEVQYMLGDSLVLQNLQDIHCTEDIPENEPTIEGNALFKARYIYQKYGKACFADDSGLEVEALNNAPGVHSARYAGEARDFHANNTLLLKNLATISNKKARFKTVIACIIEGKESLFEGIVEGEIIDSPRGNNGFGYDPIFQPNGYDKTFAELGVEVKNAISHRARAIQAFLIFLKQQELV
ncbi:MAG: non-canonical purine NTP diphosphatase [Paludibacteraceae bacterium]|nr:non-canonical purine NTP diphosphatase [Paludibacteraceae bacterium]MBP6284403.1 non-canonical purine NTP diphosphatase [Paludibacteraceae bacterium]